MKKIFLSAALALAVAGSWAFYPKAAGPSGYMMLVSKAEVSDVSLTTIASDGQLTETPVPFTKARYKFSELHKAEVLKLNQLRQEGWRVVSTHATPTWTSIGGDILTLETTYVLEKN